MLLSCGKHYLPRSVWTTTLCWGPICPHLTLYKLHVFKACFPFRLTQVIDKDVKQYWAQVQPLRNTCSVTLRITDPLITTLRVNTSGQACRNARRAFSPGKPPIYLWKSFPVQDVSKVRNRHKCDIAPYVTGCEIIFYGKEKDQEASLMCLGCKRKYSHESFRKGVGWTASYLPSTNSQAPMLTNRLFAVCTLQLTSKGGVEPTAVTTHHSLVSVPRFPTWYCSPSSCFIQTFLTCWHHSRL